MHDDNYAANICLANPGLAIAGTSSSLVKYANTFTFKANGRVSASITTANAPGLNTATLHAPYPNGTAATPGSLANLYSRTYTLIATLPINGTSTATPVYTWQVSPDFLTTGDLANVGAVTNPDTSNGCVIGWVVIANATGSAFTPGASTAYLDEGANLVVTYLNNYAYMGN